MQISGTVRPALKAEVKAGDNGLNVRNAGNDTVVLQVGFRQSPSRRVASLSQGEAVTLRTDFVQNGNFPVEIRIMAP